MSEDLFARPATGQDRLLAIFLVDPAKRSLRRIDEAYEFHTERVHRFSLVPADSAGQEGWRRLLIQVVGSASELQFNGTLACGGRRPS